MKKLLLSLSMILGLNTSALMAELTQTQLHATLGIVTNFILDDNTVYHHGIKYKPVTSPYTGRVWLDRNLGASQVCTSFDDPLCYGDYYQWGRNFDGHQVSSSATTITPASDINNAGTNFIRGSFDWASVDTLGATRATNWSKADGSSVCPAGFRVPTLSEFKAELTDIGSAYITDQLDAFDSFLKLPSAGYRNDYTGSLYGGGGYIWAINVDDTKSGNFHFNGGNVAWNSIYRAFGFSVRCIKNTIPADIVPPVITIIGGALISVPQNNSYSDDGATAIDNVDGNVTVSSISTVDTNTPGNYSILYIATDNAGNVATAIRTVIVLIVHNGTAYGTVNSPYTGRVWLDRNLGASQVCTSFDDPLCYGDYYQWGRNYDGHQDSGSGTIATQTTDVNNVGHGDFITSSSTYSYDWAHTVDSTGTTRMANWSTTDGSSVCPVGFRVPTSTELQAETIDNGVINNSTAFINFLKLPSAGVRSNYSGAFIYMGLSGYVWASSVTGSSSYNFLFASSDANVYIGYRAGGSSVRCIMQIVY